MTARRFKYDPKGFKIGALTKTRIVLFDKDGHEIHIYRPADARDGAELGKLGHSVVALMSLAYQQGRHDGRQLFIRVARRAAGRFLNSVTRPGVRP